LETSPRFTNLYVACGTHTTVAEPKYQQSLVLDATENTGCGQQQCKYKLQ